MSYARWGEDSDVYLYEHYLGFFECCGCILHIVENEVDYDFRSDRFSFDEGWHKATARFLQHLDQHRRAGHKVPADAYERLFRERWNIYEEDPDARREREEFLRLLAAGFDQ